MASGGYRPGARRPKKGEQRASDSGAVGDNGKLTPLEYMLQVMNDKKADEGRRDRMAIAAAPFVHVRPVSEVGRKKQRQAEAEAQANAGGVYAPPATTTLAVDNTK